MKRILVMTLCLVIALGVSAPTFAAEVAPCNEAPSGETVQVSPRAEVTQWCYRNNNGVLETALWSVTYGYWKTEWMPV